MNRCATIIVLLLAAGAAVNVAGCGSRQALKSEATNPALARIIIPEGASREDADRAALARFVGVWSFEGWSADSGGARSAASGSAAAVIENQHFVKLDVQVTSGQLGGRSGRKAGSMIFGSEAGLGVTLTSWGDASPNISRLIGRCEGEGSVFVFQEKQSPAGRPAVSLTVRFETNDRWVAEIRDGKNSGGPVVAAYTFTRAAN